MRGMKSRGALLGAVLGLLSASARPDALPMWQIDGASNHVVILGSIHFLRPGRNSLAPDIVRAYEDADVLLMEIDLDDIDPLAAQATMQRLGIDAQGRTLDVLLGERDYRAAAAKAGEIGFDLALLRGFEPWLAALTLTQVKLDQLGFDSESGVEQQLVKLARRDHKEIQGLETLEQQLAALDELPPPVQRAFLMQTLDEAVGMEDEIDEIVTAWQAGDTRAMEREFLDDLRSQPELYRRIVVERNRAWARQLGAVLKERRDYLVVVGTLHLVGPDSLIGMLGQAGHPARQMRTGERREVAVD